MRFFIEKLTLFFSLIVSINALVFFALLAKGKNDISIGTDNELDNKNNKSSKNGRKEHIRTCIYIVLILIIIVFIIVIVFTNQAKRYWWLFFPVTVLCILGRANETFSSLQIAKNSIRNPSGLSLSIKEKASFLAIGLFICFINNYGFTEKCIHVISTIENDYAADTLMTLTLLLVITIYYFLIVAIVIPPLRLITMWLLGTNNNILLSLTAKSEKIEEHFSGVVKEYSTIKMIEILSLKKRYRILFLAIPITIMFDLLKALLRLSIGIIIGIIRECLLALRNIRNVIFSILKNFASISDRRMTGFAFRSSLIFSIMSIVIINRYEPYVRRVDASTAIIEFIASTIVIPLLVSWVLDYKEISNVIDKKEDDSLST